MMHTSALTTWTRCIAFLHRVPRACKTIGALTEAIALYRQHGYREIEAFNDEPSAHHWFEKRLAPDQTAVR